MPSEFFIYALTKFYSRIVLKKINGDLISKYRNVERDFKKNIDPFSPLNGSMVRTINMHPHQRVLALVLGPFPPGSFHPRMFPPLGF